MIQEKLTQGSSHGTIELRLPVAEEYSRLLRLVVSGLAGRMAFDIDGLDDIKIAVEEAYLMAIAAGHGDVLTVSLSNQEGGLEVVFDNLLPDAPAADESMKRRIDYGMFIIEAVVDDAEFVQGNGGRNLRLLKRVNASGEGGDAGGAA